MTLSTLTSRIPYVGAGTVGPFAFPFRILSSADLLVTKRSAAGAETTLALTTHYTVSGVLEATGSITLVTALAVGEKIVIRRKPANTQPLSIRNLGTYYAADHEDEFDRLAMQILALQDSIDRSVKLKESLAGGASLTELEPETGKAIVGTGTGFTMSAIDTGAVALPGEGRTVSSLSSYLASNAVYNPKDFGCAGNDATDDTIPFQACLTAAAGGQCRIPNKTFRITGILNIPDFTTVIGDDRWGSNLHFEGTGDCLRNSNPFNASAYAVVSCKNFRITCNPNTRNNTGGALVVNGTGAYYEFATLHIRGPFKYGVIFDQAEVASLHHSIIENGAYTGVGTVTCAAGAATFSVSQASGLINGDIIQIGQTGRYLVSAFNGTTSCTLANVNGGGAPTFGASAFGVSKKDSANVWITNGPERTGGATPQFSNVIEILENQLNGARMGVQDDGGYGHTIRYNNVTCPLGIRICELRAFDVSFNYFEEQGQTGNECILLDDRTFAGTVRNPCQGGVINGNILLIDFAANGVAIRPTSSGAGIFHESIEIKANHTVDTPGRIGFIDLAKLKGCTIGPNFDSDTTSPHYLNDHQDANANELFHAPAATTDASKYRSIGRTDGVTQLLGDVVISQGKKLSLGTADLSQPSGGKLKLAFGATQEFLFDTGMQLGTPAGGSKGLGTLNCAGDVYKNNAVYTNPDYVFEHAFTGRVKKFAKNPGAKGYKGPLSIEQLEKYVRKNYRLPRVAQAKGIFERGDVALEKLEEAYLYIIELNERVRVLEGKNLN